MAASASWNELVSSPLSVQDQRINAYILYHSLFATAGFGAIVTAAFIGRFVFLFFHDHMIQRPMFWLAGTPSGRVQMQNLLTRCVW